MDYETMEHIAYGLSTAITGLLAYMGGVHRTKARIPVEIKEAEAKAVSAEATSTSADADLVEAQTKQFALLFEHINTLTARLDTEMRRTTTLQEDVLGIRKWAGDKLALKDTEIKDLKATIALQEEELVELRARVKELEKET